MTPAWDSLFVNLDAVVNLCPQDIGLVYKSSVNVRTVISEPASRTQEEHQVSPLEQGIRANLLEQLQ